jgi:hypothetical protein
MNNYLFYLNESLNDRKIQWLKIIDPSNVPENAPLKKLIGEVVNNFYDVVNINGKKKVKLDTTKPILSYFADNKGGDKILFDNNISFSDIYNDKKEVSKSGSKKLFHEVLGDVDYIPKTVTNVKDIDKLSFPIVGKPASGHSGIGIVKVDNKEELEKELKKRDLDVFSEAINNIDTEYRLVFVKDKLIIAYERIPVKELNKTLDTKDPDDSLQFLYVEQDLDKHKFKLDKMLKDFKSKIDLDFFALDVIEDKNGKLWLLESNSAIGMGANTLAEVY